MPAIRRPEAIARRAETLHAKCVSMSKTLFSGRSLCWMSSPSLGCQSGFRESFGTWRRHLTPGSKVSRNSVIYTPGRPEPEDPPARRPPFVAPLQGPPPLQRRYQDLDRVVCQPLERGDLREDVTEDGDSPLANLRGRVRLLPVRTRGWRRDPAKVHGCCPNHFRDDLSDLSLVIVAELGNVREVLFG